MRKTSLRMTRGLMVLMVALGLMGLTSSPAGAQGGEFCAPEGDWFLLSLVDPTEDGVISVDDLQFIADGLPAGEQRDTFQGLIDQAEAQGVTGIRYEATGACAPATATTVPSTSTTVPAATSTTEPGIATSTTVPAATATTVPGTATATTGPGIATSTTVPGTVAATTVPDDDDDNGLATTAPDDDNGNDGTVVTLPDTGQGPGASQGGNTTFVMLLGGMSLLMGAAVLWGKRRTA